MGDVIWCRPRNGKNEYSWQRGKVSGDSVHMDDGRMLLLCEIEMDMDICRGNLLLSLDLDDLGMLTHLNEPSMVHCLEERFMADKVYCNTGEMLLAINPFKMIPKLYDIDMYQELQTLTKKLPHVFTTANDTYQALHAIHPTTNQHQNQTVLVSGESGSGKTESTKFIMQYLAVVSKSDEPNNISDQVLQSNPILESFGNARTLRNDNSSRFGKFVKIWFSPEKHNQLRLIGTTIETYLLEKVRLVHQAQGERNFHIFYELLAEAKSNKLLRESLHLHSPATAFTYLKDGDCYLRQDNVRDIDEFHKTMKAMDIVGFQEDEKALQCASILEVVASMLHLGNMKFGLKPGGGGADASISDVSTLKELEWVSELLAVDKERLRSALTKRQIKAKDEWYVVHLTVEQAEEARDAMARSIYGYLFDWIVCKVNLCIGGREFKSTDRFIGVLDIFGFESFEFNSFEQLCINYANERLQYHFIDFV
ncbi:myosin, partial [Thraustotheca clavata]